MATVTKRTNKDGSTVYKIRAFIEEGPGGKQITKSTTWSPPPSMRPSAADKQADKEAVLFEGRCRSGVVSVDAKTKFEDYAARWMETAELAPKTHEQYVYLLKRINTAIGQKPLEKLQVDHIKRFIKNLREAGIKEAGNHAVSIDFEEQRKAAKLTQRKLSELSGVSINTIAGASHGRPISIKTSQKLCTALNLSVEKVFTIEKGYQKLSNSTVWHHYKLIHAILEGARESKILLWNAADYKGAPSQPKSDAKYYDDKEARRFLAALLEEPDIRIKTALIIYLFTGLRRGELAGLSWSDIDFIDNNIRVRRASQYVTGQGIIEVPTKNESSMRDIVVSQFVVDILKDYKTWWVDYRFNIGDIWKGEKERLFIQVDGKPIFPDTINNWMDKFVAKHGFQRLTPKGLRHTFATLQITAGVDLRTLQARTGHAQASTLLNIYSHAIQSAQDKAAQLHDDVLLGSVNDANKKSG